MHMFGIKPASYTYMYMYNVHTDKALEKCALLTLNKYLNYMHK